MGFLTENLCEATEFSRKAKTKIQFSEVLENKNPLLKCQVSEKIKMDYKSLATIKK